MSTISARSVLYPQSAANAGPPRATEYSAVALALTCVSLALAPVGGTVAGVPCACAVVAMLLSLVADRSPRRMVSAIWELLVATALLTTTSAILVQAFLVEPQAVPLAATGMRGVSAAFALAAALLGASRALHRLGSGARS